MPCPQVGTEVSAHSGTRKIFDDSNGELLKKAFHIVHCVCLKTRFRVQKHEMIFFLNDLENSKGIFILYCGNRHKKIQTFSLKRLLVCIII